MVNHLFHILPSDLFVVIFNMKCHMFFDAEITLGLTAIFADNTVDCKSMWAAFVIFHFDGDFT